MVKYPATASHSYANPTTDWGESRYPQFFPKTRWLSFQSLESEEDLFICGFDVIHRHSID
uniref:Uncharacterized protein n=1 Tax=Anguilla anguilla TaxID=7936 RepID=A0A0E9TZN4_ANGAN